MATALVLPVAAFFLGMGLLGLIAPGKLIAPFGIELGTATARTEVRAVYGGFGLATGVLLTLAAFDVGGIRHGVAITVAVALAGMAFGRLIGRLAERPEKFYPSSFYLCVELISAAMLVAVTL
ncbi:MAG: DUF4345 domain-containing protein [Micromonosporaceae bacterium]